MVMPNDASGYNLLVESREPPQQQGQTEPPPSVHGLARLSFFAVFVEETKRKEKKRGQQKLVEYRRAGKKHAIEH